LLQGEVSLIQADWRITLHTAQVQLILTPII
jgi:hypothetical protein